MPSGPCDLLPIVRSHEGEAAHDGPGVSAAGVAGDRVVKTRFLQTDQWMALPSALDSSDSEECVPRPEAAWAHRD